MNLKTKEEIQIMREGGKILKDVLDQLQTAVTPGLQTKELDKLARELISSNGAEPSFLNYNGFPAALCVSINEEIVHGLPSSRVLKDGDLLKLDLGVFYKGFHTDSARSVLIGSPAGGSNNRKKLELISVTEEALLLGIEAAQVGNTLGDIGCAIQEYVEEHGFNVVRDLVGHGIGKKVHEEPEVLNYGRSGTGPKLIAGMVIAIEPLVVEGKWQITDGSDGFAYVTKDGKLAAHAEHTVAISKDGPIVLTT